MKWPFHSLSVPISPVSQAQMLLRGHQNGSGAERRLPTPSRWLIGVVRVDFVAPWLV